MIPFVPQPMWQVGSLTVSAFGVIVAAAATLGLSIGRARFEARRLDREIGARIGTWMLVGGFAGAHVFSVLFYFPEQLVSDPLLLLRFWEDVSSMGGMIGGLLALYLVLRSNASIVTPAQRWEYVGAAAYAFPFALFVGRIACSLAHDHPGIVTTFPLAVSLKTDAAETFIRNVYGAAQIRLDVPLPSSGATGFHDLGIYECLYLGVVVLPATWLIGRSKVRPEMSVMAFIGLYMPARFLLDFLRVEDSRYAGLTPAQWVCLLALAIMPLLAAHAKKASRLTCISMIDDGEAT
jgi:phosphatidylglycerol:prolipoprotein diacylglycerol transferase